MSNRRRSGRPRNRAPASGRQPDRAQPSQDEPEVPDGYVLIGRVIRPHGVDGTLRVQPYSDNPNRFRPGSSITIADSLWTVESFRRLPDGYALLRLDEMDSADDGRGLSDAWLLAPIDTAADLEQGEYYHYQLVGLTVLTDEGENLGSLSEVLETGSNDVYIVRSVDGSEILLPAITQVIKKVDLAAGTMLVHLLDGLR